MTKTDAAASSRTCREMRTQIDDFLSGRLESEGEVAFEAHLLVCDACFTSYFVRTVDEI